MTQTQIDWALDTLHSIGEIPDWFYTPDQWNVIRPRLPADTRHVGDRYVTPEWREWRLGKAAA